MYRGLLADVDTVTEPGLYRTNSSTKNLPSSAYKFGLVEVFRATDTNVLLKRYTSNDGETYTRMKYESNLQKWYKHDGTALG